MRNEKDVGISANRTVALGDGIGDSDCLKSRYVEP